VDSSEGGAAGVDTAPFDLAGDGRAAALCLHGLTGTPYEVRPLGEELAARGTRALGPALPGHNETPERLTSVPWSAWIDAARTHLRALRAHHQCVYLVGLSMGGLVSLYLAAEEEVDALVVVGTPLRLAPWMRVLIPAVKHVYRFAPKRTGSDILDEAARLRHPSYEVMPLAGVHEVLRLQRRVRRALPKVTAPILVAHGAHDVTANPANAREIYRRVTSRERELLILEDSAHVVPVDRDGPRLARAAADFLSRHAEC
jgi:carboxylesterase